MEIKAADVAKLRKMTGAGMMDCKKALQEAEGDFARAQEIIREKGKLIANKRADREASEGFMASKIIGNVGYLMCLACETDFVAKNEEFVASANEILDIAVSNDVADLAALLATEVNGRPVSDIITEKSGQTGEKVEVPFYVRIEAPKVAVYVHSNSKLGSIVGFNVELDETVAKDVAMQATAMAPVSIDKDDCPAEILEQEYKIGMEQARQEGKPEAILEKIAEGKVAKFLKDNTLANQALVKDNKLTVAQYIAQENKDAKIIAYKRFSLND